MKLNRTMKLICLEDCFVCSNFLNINFFNIFFFKEQLQNPIKNTINISLDETSSGKYKSFIYTYLELTRTRRTLIRTLIKKNKNTKNIQTLQTIIIKISRCLPSIWEIRTSNSTIIIQIYFYLFQFLRNSKFWFVRYWEDSRKFL